MTKPPDAVHDLGGRTGLCSKPPVRSIGDAGSGSTLAAGTSASPSASLAAAGIHVFGPLSLPASAAAIEQFIRDTAPPPTAPGPRMSPWLRAGLYAGTGRDPAGPSPWGEPERWGSA